MAKRGEKTELGEVAQGVREEITGIHGDRRLLLQSHLFRLADTTIALDMASASQNHARDLVKIAKDASDSATIAVRAAENAETAAYSAAYAQFAALADQANHSTESQEEFMRYWLIMHDKEALPLLSEKVNYFPAVEKRLQVATAIKDGESVLFKNQSRLSMPLTGTQVTVKGSPIIGRTAARPVLIFDTTSQEQSKERHHRDSVDWTNIEHIEHPVVLEIENLTDTVVVGKPAIVKYLNEEYQAYDIERELEKYDSIGVDFVVNLGAIKKDARIIETISALDLEKECKDLYIHIVRSTEFNIGFGLGIYEKFAPGLRLSTKSTRGEVNPEEELSRLLDVFTTIRTSSKEPYFFHNTYEIIYQIASRVAYYQQEGQKLDNEVFLLRVAHLLEELKEGKTEFDPFAPLPDNPESQQRDTELLLSTKARLLELNSQMKNMRRNLAINTALATKASSDEVGQ